MPRVTITGRGNIIATKQLFADLWTTALSVLICASGPVKCDVVLLRLPDDCQKASYVLPFPLFLTIKQTQRNPHPARTAATRQK